MNYKSMYTTPKFQINAVDVDGLLELHILHQDFQGDIYKQVFNLKDAAIKQSLESLGWTAPKRTSSGKEVIHFYTYQYDNHEIVNVWRWDGYCWVWDEHKDTMIETMRRYPFDKFVWVSVDE